MERELIIQDKDIKALADAIEVANAYAPNEPWTYPAFKAIYDAYKKIFGETDNYLTYGNTNY